jgi:hypothetical protein
MRWFWPVWITITAAAAVFMVVALRPGVERARQATERPANLVLAWRQVGTPGAIATLTLIAMFLASYVALTLVWEDFAYYDNEYYTLVTLKGHNIGLEISRETGRFTPLANQEFNLMRYFTDTVVGYHVLPIIELLSLFYVLLVIDDELDIRSRVLFAIFALLTPSILTSFNGLIFSERNVLLFLSCVLLSVGRFERTRSIQWAVAAVVCAQFMIYYKETAALLLLSFGTGRLVLRLSNGSYARWRYDRLCDRESLLDLCFACLSVLFLTYYVAEMRLHANLNYAATARQPLAELVLGYTRIDLLAWLLVAVLLARSYLILYHRVVPLLLWDGLAIGGVTCFLAYLYLRIFGIYFLAPVDLIAVLYVGRFAVLSWKKMRSRGKIATMMLALIVVLQNILVSAYAVFERKNVIHGKAEIASAVEARYRNNAGNDLRLFFPFATPYVIMEFAAYLTHRGVSVEGAAGEPANPNMVVLAAKTLAQDGPCVEWVSIRCHAGSGPAPGDLVIVLPDDNVSLAQTSIYRDRRELLLFYEPFPHIPDWLHTLFDSFYIGTTRLRHEQNPERWMDGSVTMWK